MRQDNLKHARSMHEQDFSLHIELIENALALVVEIGSDDELFISSYLHGHFSLAVSHAELSQQMTLDQLDNIVTASLDAAFANKELEEPDQRKVSELWSHLIEQACAKNTA